MVLLTDRKLARCAAILLSAASLICAPGALAQSASNVQQFNGDLNQLIPSLYGGDGITLFASPVFNHSAHFTAQALEKLTVLSASLSGRASPSFNLTPANAFEFDPISEEYIPIESLGSPSFYAEPATTIGRGRTGRSSAAASPGRSRIGALQTLRLHRDFPEERRQRETHRADTG